MRLAHLIRDNAQYMQGSGFEPRIPHLFEQKQMSCWRRFLKTPSNNPTLSRTPIDCCLLCFYLSLTLFTLYAAELNCFWIFLCFWSYISLLLNITSDFINCDWLSAFNALYLWYDYASHLFFTMFFSFFCWFLFVNDKRGRKCDSI